MSVSGVNSAVTVPQSLKSQEPSTPKTQAPKTAGANENAAAENAAQKATQIATERQASTRGDGRSINKLA
jgi:hypothetical protein